MAGTILPITVPVLEGALFSRSWYSFLADFFRRYAARPQVFVQATDPGAAARENDLWVWAGTKRRVAGNWVNV